VEQRREEFRCGSSLDARRYREALLPIWVGPSRNDPHIGGPPLKFAKDSLRHHPIEQFFAQIKSSEIPLLTLETDKRHAPPSA
jgi:hypothetical protein